MSTAPCELDLDIRNYTASDLRAFFRFKPGTKVSESDIELRKYEIREALLSGNYIPKGRSHEFAIFMSAAEAALIADMCAPKTEKTGPQFGSSNQGRPSDVVHRTPVSQTVNEFDVRTISRVVPIDSRFRDNAYSTSGSNFVVALPAKLSGVITLDVASFEINLSRRFNVYKSIRNNYFTVRIFCVSGNRRPKWNETEWNETEWNETEWNETECRPGENEPQVCEFVVSVPDGCYTTASLVKEIGSVFREDTESILSALVIDVESDASDKVVIYSTDERVHSIELDFSLDEMGHPEKKDYFTKLGRVLGFTRRKYGGNTEYRSETAADPSMCVRYCYLEIADFQNQYAATFVSAFHTVSLPSSVIAKLVFPDSGKWDQKTEVIVQPRRYFGPTDISRIQVRLLDPYGAQMNLEHADMSFTLVAKCVYS